MFLVQWLNRRYTNPERLRAYVGLPNVSYSYHGGTLRLPTEDGKEKSVSLSKYTASRWGDFIRENETIFYTERDDRKAVYGGPGMKVLQGFVAATLFGVGYLYSPSADPLTAGIVAALVACLPNEIWSYIAIAKLKVITEFTKDSLCAEAAQIIADDERDLELCNETKALIATYQEKLSASDVVCDEDTKVDAQSSGAWRVVDVQYHNVVDSPSDRDVTITLSSDEHDGLVCILPGVESIQNWLDSKLDGMRRRVHWGTHTGTMLESLRAIDILKPVWQPPQNVLAEVAKMLASSKQPFAERTPVIVHGELLPAGQVILQAIGFENSGTDTARLVFAPTAPVQQLSAVVLEQWQLKGGHPVLLEVDEAA